MWKYAKNAGQAEYTEKYKKPCRQDEFHPCKCYRITELQAKKTTLREVPKKITINCCFFAFFLYFEANFHIWAKCDFFPHMSEMAGVENGNSQNFRWFLASNSHPPPVLWGWWVWHLHRYVLGGKREGGTCGAVGGGCGGTGRGRGCWGHCGKAIEITEKQLAVGTIGWIPNWLNPSTSTTPHHIQLQLKSCCNVSLIFNLIRFLEFLRNKYRFQTYMTEIWLVSF